MMVRPTTGGYIFLLMFLVILPTVAAYKQHMEHAEFQPTKYLVQDYPSETVFQRPKIYCHHLLTAHNITDRYEKDKLTPKYKLAYTPRKCLVEGCKSKQTWLRPGKLREHLQAKHHLDDEAIEALVR
jgi:hypothetical protein